MNAGVAWGRTVQGGWCQGFELQGIFGCKGEAVVGRQQVALTMETRASNHISSLNVIFCSPLQQMSA